MKGQKYFLVALGVLALALVGLVSRQGGVDSAVAQPSAAVALDGGLGVTVSVSNPANGGFFVAGEKAVVTIGLKDKQGVALNKSDFATLSLYAYGPQETAKTVSAVKLLNATTDRTKTPHHYINLLTDAGAVLECCASGQTRPSGLEGNVLKYTFQPVTDEEPGTYTVALWFVKNGSPPVNQAFVLADFQLGTATIEKQIVEKENCAKCHQGAQNGQFYLHHVDPGRSPYGSPSIDSIPVRTCKACHNNEGYAAYAGDANNPAGPSTVRTPDPIVRRVHGVHMGEELKNPFNNDPETGNFKAYLGVVFPADVRNCTYCHTDNRWQTQVTRQACTACHDNVWFGDATATPAKFVNHPGGPQASDSGCAACHTPSTGPLSVAVVHDPAVNVEHDDAVLTMSAPANGKFYVAGEKPVVTIVYKDTKGSPIDHTKVDTLLNAANFYVYGPREQSKPVLTTAAKLGRSKSKASANSSIAASGTPKGWTFAAGDTFKIAVNGGAAKVLNAPAGAKTQAEVVTWLSSELTGVTVSASGDNINILSSVEGENSRIEIYNSAVTTKMGWKPGGLDIIEHGKVVGKTVGTTVEPFVVIGAPSTQANSLLGTADPAVTRTADKITYQLDDVAGLTPGTYMAYSYTTIKGVNTQNGWARSAFGMTEFQVGTATLELKVAGNCATCHGETVMHLNERNVHPAVFDPDNCKACHDYQRFGTGESFSRVGGTSTLGWSGYGAKPIAARIHGVHFGAYLNHKEDVYAGNPNMASEIIFPQDVRNCTVCHTSKGSNSWKENPSRLACNACHDSDLARSHAKLQTEIPNPADTFSESNTETCKVCHGVGKDFAVEKVHDISNPYKPPYPREAE